jgi:hypothetical protein
LSFPEYLKFVLKDVAETENRSKGDWISLILGQFRGICRTLRKRRNDARRHNWNIPEEFRKWVELVDKLKEVQEEDDDDDSTPTKVSKATTGRKKKASSAPSSSSKRVKPTNKTPTKPAQKRTSGQRKYNPDTDYDESHDHDSRAPPTPPLWSKDDDDDFVDLDAEREKSASQPNKIKKRKLVYDENDDE